MQVLFHPKNNSHAPQWRIQRERSSYKPNQSLSYSRNISYSRHVEYYSTTKTEAIKQIERKCKIKRNFLQKFKPLSHIGVSACVRTAYPDSGSKKGTPQQRHSNGSLRSWYAAWSPCTSWCGDVLVRTCKVVTAYLRRSFLIHSLLGGVWMAYSLLLWRIVAYVCTAHELRTDYAPCAVWRCRCVGIALSNILRRCMSTYYVNMTILGKRHTCISSCLFLCFS